MHSIDSFDFEVISVDAEILRIQMAGYKSFKLMAQFGRSDFHPKELGDIFRLLGKLADLGFKEEAVDHHNAEMKKDIQ